MTQGKWSRLSPTEKTDIWNRWKAGQTLHEIGRAQPVLDLAAFVAQLVRALP